jgi:hypothetical protein
MERTRELAYSCSMTSKDEILAEIRRLARENSGEPVGRNRFLAESGIKRYDIDRYWIKWSEAIAEAGFQPRTLQQKNSTDVELIRKMADLTLELGHYPTAVECRHRRYSDASFPSHATFINRFGNRLEIISKLFTLSHEESGYEGLMEILAPLMKNDEVQNLDTSVTPDFGYVYLIQMEKWYKIGFTRDILRRQGEIRLVLPSQEHLIHTIETDDPSGVEHYWHRRFADRRSQGEWFELSRADVSAFRKWRRIS